MTLSRACRAWHCAPASMCLTSDDVHVWRIPLAVSQRVVADLVPLLSEEEIARAKQRLDDDTHRRFIASHGALRMILSRYLDIGPEQVSFVTDSEGKPHLAGIAGDPAICFSLSHCQALALCAVTKGRAVGVDLERIRPVSAWREVAVRYFSRRENEALRSLSEDEALGGFFHCWTRKEAYSKALGRGVSQRWRQSSVSLVPGVDQELMSAELESWAESRFTLCALEPGNGHVAAVAGGGVGWRLSCWQWCWAGEQA